MPTLWISRKLLAFSAHIAEHINSASCWLLVDMFVLVQEYAKMRQDSQLVYNQNLLTLLTSCVLSRVRYFDKWFEQLKVVDKWMKDYP